ncbi:MAG: hypothetical protein ABI151_05295 [Chitinophagaceae bacterium]
MKTIQLFGLSIILMLQGAVLSAQDLPEFTKLQTEKTRVFDRVPSKFSVYAVAMDRLFSLKANSKVVIPLDGSNFIEGTVLEVVQHNEQVTSINISASNFDGAMLTLSRKTIPGQPVTYVGRLISMKHGDAFMMTMQGSEIVFSKQQQSLTVAE